MKIAYIVISTGRYHDTRVKAVCNSWGRDVHGLFIFSDQACAYGNVVALNVPSDYTGAALKTVEALLYFKTLSELPFDWFFVADDDTFVFTENLKQFLRAQISKTQDNQNTYYGVPLSGHKELKDLTWPSGGAGYFFHRDVLKKLFDILPYQTLYSHSDLTLGVAFSRLGISMTPCPTLYQQEPETILRWAGAQGIRPEQTFASRPISFHRITPERMGELYARKCLFECAPGEPFSLTAMGPQALQVLLETGKTKSHEGVPA